MVVYVRYARNGQSQTKFMELTELNGDEYNAKNLTETIISILEMSGLNIQDMACITTDGASVMTSVRAGVTGHVLYHHRWC